jgi:hypothetical protein
MWAGRTGAGALALCAAICAAPAAAPAATAQVAYGPMLVGVASSRPAMEIVNHDLDPVTLGQPALSGSDATAFRMTSDTCGGRTLASGEECAVSVMFWPKRIGTHAATLQVPLDGNPGAPYSVALSGEGIPWLRLTPSVLDFGTVLVRSSATQDVLVENVSGRDISDLSPRIASPGGGFGLDRAFPPDRCGTTLAVGATCRLGVNFTPHTAGANETRLRFLRIGQDLGSTVTLRGTGAPGPAATPIRYHTPDATAVLRKRLRAAVTRLRGQSREVLLKRGLIVRGIVAPVQGVLRVVVDALRGSSGATVVAARRRLAVQPGRPATIRARLTRAGRRLLRSGRRLVLDVRLTLVADADSRLSAATGVLRLGQARQRR